MSALMQLMLVVFVAAVFAGVGLWIGLKSAWAWEKMITAAIKWAHIKVLKMWGG
jgi:hypothetical protein